MLNEQQIAEKSTIEKILRVEWHTDQLLTFTTTRPSQYSFVAGQYARLGVRDSSGSPIWRAYSMTSAPSDNVLEFYGVIVPGGLFTGFLKDMRLGDGILVDKQSFGFMTPDRFTDGDDLWMFATGTGIGPYISMLRDPYVWRQFRTLILVHGVRREEEFAYHDELARMQQQSPFPGTEGRLLVIRSTTRESPGPVTGISHLTGRVTTLLQDGTLEQATGIPMTEASSRIMLCGNPQMIEDMRRILHERGMRPMRRTLPGQFVTENYW